MIFKIFQKKNHISEKTRSFGHLVICQNRKQTVKIRHYNINFIYIIVSFDRVSEIDFDQMTLTILTTCGKQIVDLLPTLSLSWGGAMLFLACSSDLFDILLPYGAFY